MRVSVGCMVMLTRPHYPENQGRIGQVILAVPIVAHVPVTDTWLVDYPSPVMTTDGLNRFSCSEGWRLTVIAPPEDSLQSDVEAPQPVSEPA